MANDPTDLNQYPIGSTSFVPAGAPDIGNASVLDKLINGGNIEVENRAGATLPSYEKAIADSQLAYGGLTNKGDWAPSTSYLVNDIWKSAVDGTCYLVLQNYTSGASEQIDIDAGYVQVWQGFSKLDVIARHNGVQTSNVSTLSLSTISSVNYLYDDATETTYYCPQELTGTVSNLGTDVDGIRTITVDSVNYLIYSEDHYSLLKESINYATSNLAGGDSDLVGVIYKGVTIDALDWLIYPNDGRIYFNDSETGSFSGDFNPSTGTDSGLSDALTLNPAITEVRMSSAESAISQNSSDIATNASDIATNSSDISAVDTLKKSDSFKAALYLDGSDLKTSQKIQVINVGDVFNINADTLVTPPTLSDGVDYKVFCLSDGSLSAQDWDATDPVGAINIGGFHVYHTTGGINPSSIWDIRWRPSSSPRAMTLSPDGKTWVDIYLADTDYGLNGYSQSDATIADNVDAPIIPALYGGDGTATYGTLTWFEAWDLAINAGKRLPLWGEFTGFAYGVVEQQSVGTDPVTTKYQAGHRSACGVEQVTGAMWQWGADCQGNTGGGWQAITDGRGSVYNSGVSAVRLGAKWDGGSNAGSRSADWYASPSYSSASVGLRAVCDHQII